MLHPPFHKNKLRTEFLGTLGGHGTVNAESSGFITGRRDDAPLVGVSYRNGFTAVFRMIPLFDRCIKRIHVNVNDLAVLHSRFEKT